MIDEVLLDTKTKMQKAIEALRKELSTIRTGRASPALVENIRAEYYGVPTPLSQMASISVPEARLLVIQPWDRSALGTIEKAILKSDLGLNPTNDGAVIRLSLPQLTEERRKELVRVVKKRVEEGRVAIRNLRREGIDKIKAAETNKEMSKDEEKRAEEQFQTLTDRFISEADAVGESKQKELTEF